MMVSDIRSKLQGVHGPESSFTARCPAHDDKRNSLSVTVCDGGKILLHCHAGCATPDIAAAMGIKTADLFSEKPRFEPKVIERTYDYRDAEGKLIFQAVRYRPKDFRQRRPDPDRPGEWVWNLNGIERPLYRTPELRPHIAAKDPIIICEGEKDCDRLWSLGIPATTNAGGAAAKWRPEYSATLEGCPIVAVPDNDEPGRKHAREICEAITTAVCLELPGLPPKGDVSNWLDAGHTADEFLELAHAAIADPPPIPQPETKPAEVSETASVAELKGKVLTELATAQRLKKTHGNELRHNSGLGWLSYDRKRWLRSDKRAARMTQGMGAEIRKELVALGAVHSDIAKAYYSHARDMERAAGVDNILQHARCLDGIDADDITFDAHPWFLNCPNGTVDVRTGKMRPHDPADYLTALCPTPYDPDALAPRWDLFLDEIFDDDETIRDYFQWIAGLSLSGCTAHDLFLVLWGQGANGKSTAINTLLHTIGPDYGQQLDPETLLIQRFQKPSTDLAQLRGIRLAVAVETSEGRRLNEPLIKGLTGGDKLRARLLYHDAFEFQPELKLFIASNHLPVIKDDSKAMWRRVRLIPFTRQFLGDAADHNLEATLRAEAPGILAWAVRGIVDRWEHEPSIPAAVKAASDTYRDDSDTIAAFVKEECQTGPGHTVAIAKLYIAYQAFMSGSCESKRKFCDRIRARGFESDRGTGGTKEFRGISLSENNLPGMTYGA